MAPLSSTNGPPLVDLAVLYGLEQQLDDRSMVVGFVRDFMDLWESRYGRLASALQTSDPDAAMDALLGLKTSAAMAGALRLSRDAEELEDAVKRGDSRAANILLPKLEACGQMTLQEFRDLYIKQLGS